jgi:cation:H+ antiporter
LEKREESNVMISYESDIIFFPLMSILLGIIALPFLLIGAELIVKHGRLIAKNLGISGFFIGLTVVSIGTSIPELFTHVMSASRMLLDPSKNEVLAGIAIGTNVGSNIFQITAIVGIVGLYGHMKTTKAFMLRDYVMMLLGIALVWFFSVTGQSIQRWEGWVLILSYAAYLWYLTQLEEIDEKMENHNNYHPLKSVLMIILAFALVIIAADFILDAAILATETFGLSGSLIGAAMIGVCTALPELTTALIAVKKKAKGLSVGTLVGSNITNPLLGVGLGAIIVEHPVDPVITSIDFPFWFGISLLGWLFFWTKKELGKWQAGVMLSSYLVYVLFRIGYWCWQCTFG